MSADMVVQRRDGPLRLREIDVIMYTVGLYCIRYLALRCSSGNDASAEKKFAIRVVSVAMFSCTWCSGVVHILYNARGVGTGRDFVMLCYNTGRGYLSHCYVMHFA